MGAAPSEVEVHVHMLSGQEIKLNIDPETTTVGQLKMKLFEESGIPPRQQHLVTCNAAHSSTVLTDLLLVLKDWNTIAEEISNVPRGDNNVIAFTLVKRPSVEEEEAARVVSSVPQVATPGMPFEVQFGHIGEEKIQLDWRVTDPDPARCVKSCELEVLANPMIGAPYWQAAKLDGGINPIRVDDDRWRATILGLVADTGFRLRICAHNSAGPGEYVRFEIKTSGLPPLPSSFQCIGRPPGSAPGTLALGWRFVGDFAGTVNNCEVQMASFSGSTGGWETVARAAAAAAMWEDVDFSRDQAKAPRLVSDGCWRATLVGLADGYHYEFRLRGVSHVGKGDWMRQHFRTLAR